MLSLDLSHTRMFKYSFANIRNHTQAKFLAWWCTGEIQYGSSRLRNMQDLVNYTVLQNEFGYSVTGLPIHLSFNYCVFWGCIAWTRHDTTGRMETTNRKHVANTISLKWPVVFKVLAEDILTGRFSITNRFHFNIEIQIFTLYMMM